MRVLFVDDDPAILEGIENLLRRKRREWQVELARGGAEAITRLQESHYDAVVTDMRMPEVDGVAVLEAAQRLLPDARRVVLSGHTGDEQMLRALPVVHELLAKPCALDALERALDGHRAPRRSELHRRIDAVSLLPMVMPAHREMRRAGETPAEVARVLEQHPVLLAAVTEVVAPRFRATEASCLVALFGDPLGVVVLGVELLLTHDDEPAWDRAIRSAHLAAQRCPAELAADAFAAGFVQDLGMLVLRTRAPQHHRQLEAALVDSNGTRAEAEHALFGFDHGHLMGLLLDGVDAPPRIVRAVTNHHRRDGADELERAVQAAARIVDAEDER